MADELAQPLARTALAWRRTALALVGLSVVILQVIDWTGAVAGAVLGFACLMAAAVVVGIAEHGVRRMSDGASRPVFALISATAVPIMFLAATGLVLAITA